MLRDASTDVKEHYYDLHFHGVDWDARVAKAQDEIAKASSLNMAMSHVAAALDSLNDSHTFFLPPMRPYRHDYGFLLQMIGDRCFVIRVRPRSDAEAKGVKPGDELLAINGFGLSRNSLWKVEYVFNSLRPQPGLRLILKDLSGAERQVDVLAQIEQIVGGGRYGTEDAGDLARQDEDARHRRRARGIAVDHGIGVLKLPVFEFSASNVADMMEEMRAYKSLVLDLRGNPGGAVDTLKAFVSSLFRKEVKIMIDGKSLEHAGVVPDEIVLPTAADLAEGRDPVLANAIETLGGRISPQNAGNLFPFEWPTR